MTPSGPGLVFCAWCGQDNFAPMTRSDKPDKRNPSIEIARLALDLVLKDIPEEEFESELTY